MINLSEIAIVTAFLIATTSAFANEAVIAAEPFARVKSAASDTVREKLSSTEAKKTLSSFPRVARNIFGPLVSQDSWYMC